MILTTFTALWLGILTAISPCPLATNIASISILAKNIESPIKTVLQGIIYTIGRSLSYIVLAVVIINSLVSTPVIIEYLDKYLNKTLGIILIILGMIISGIIKFNVNIKLANNSLIENLKKSGIIGVFLLGCIFALSFCPVSAGIYFGGLIPISIEANSKFILPIAYGLGTGLPVLIFAILVAFSTNLVGKIYHNINKIEQWFRKITGIIFIIAGIYHVASHQFGFTF